ncbi:MAG: hypothetical protein KDK07_21585, partial [Bauldia sp.]|nr:hypothetical protein [Bauldia sp.]
MADFTNENLPPNPVFDGNDPPVITIVSDSPAVDLTTATFQNWDSSTNVVTIDGSSQSASLSITGSSENDVITGGSGDDTIAAGAGDDTINYTIGDGTDSIDGGAHVTGDTLAITGTTNDDVIDVTVTGGVISTVEGMSPTGIELFTLDGLGESTGGDTLSYAATTEAVTVDLSSPSATGFSSIAGIENVTG